MSGPSTLSYRSIYIALLLLSIAACSGGGGGGEDDGASITSVACTSTLADSVDNSPATWTRIHSEANGTPLYYSLTLTRQTLGASGPSVSMDYMVHPSVGTAKALVVLIAGGALDAAIEGTGDATTPTSAGGNFVVRSAHLFAAQGYQVLTIDRPSDFNDYLPGGFNYQYDQYRVSMEHAVDLSEVINVVNAADNLPVILVGTSRGAISAVLQHRLAAALAISSPVTTGNGTPVSNALAAMVSEPVQVSWHKQDACNVTTPANSQTRVDAFQEAIGVAISGGFSNPGADVCNGDAYHGFPGIESCAVMQATDWMATQLADLSTTRPVTVAQTSSTTMNTPKMIDLSSAATAANAGALTYSIPFATTSLGGTVTINGTTVTYNPPSGVSGINDTFVFIVTEAGGGTANNVVAVTIS